MPTVMSYVMQRNSYETIEPFYYTFRFRGHSALIVLYLVALIGLWFSYIKVIKLPRLSQPVSQHIEYTVWPKK